MKLIVGLGNPGNEYNRTRHNVGFEILDNYAKKHNFEIKKEKFNGLYENIEINHEKIIFLKPQSFMNLSGTVVKKYLDYFKIGNEDLLVIHDDLDISLGNIKLKEKGRCAGHNGLRNIEQCINSQEFKRIKIGISRNDNIKSHVLGKFSVDEQKKIDNIVPKLFEIIDLFNIEKFDNIMNKYNIKNN
ncbi:MAG: aminoacyl-tRNA hydrolase [Mycoplasmatota bacterium]